jgi:ATP-binding protein involved in chromosome partitioning
MTPDSTPSVAAVEAALGAFHDPYRDASLADSANIEEVDVAAGDGGASVTARVRLGYPAEGVRADWEARLAVLVEALPGVASAKIELAWEVLAQQPQKDLQAMARVRNVLAVASGKGGVGKSTTAANLALALAAEGARVGILDADIYGPSQGLMLGVAPGRRPDVLDEKLFVPIKALGIEAMSMSFLADASTPMVWRGPMVSGALQQLIGQTAWSDLDYLVVDMPPGTGDIQLTLSQRIPVAGAVVVTTPQDIALIDAIKGIEMFRKVDVPVLGIIENMSVHVCSACGHTEHLFGAGGGAKIAERYDTTLLGALPLSMDIREQADSGRPTVAAEPDGPVAAVYRDVARLLAARLAARGGTRRVPAISITDD